MKSEQQIKDQIELIENLRKIMPNGTYLQDEAKGRVDALKWVIEQKD